MFEMEARWEPMIVQSAIWNAWLYNLSLQALQNADKQNFQLQHVLLLKESMADENLPG